MSDKFLAVVKLKTGEEIIAKIKPSPELDVIALDCPAMVGHSSFTRKPGVSVIKIEPWIKTGREQTYIVEMSNVITTCEVTDEDVIKAYNRFVKAYYETEPPKEKPNPKMTKIKADPFADKGRAADDEADDIDRDARFAADDDEPPFKGGKPSKDDDSEYDVGGPSYPKVPKGVKTSADAKGVMKARDLAKQAMDIDPEIDKKAMSAADDANEKMAMAEVPSIRISQITTAEQDVIRPDHIAKTYKALKKAGSNKADKFKELGDAYAQAEKDRNTEYYKYYKEDEPSDSESNKKASKVFEDGITKQKKVGFLMQKL